jgi:hypothetical protein
MSTDDTSYRTGELAWFKSSYSGTSGGDCVEVAIAPEAVHVRDSKDTARRGVSVSKASWDAFAAHLRD